VGVPRLNEVVLTATLHDPAGEWNRAVEACGVGRRISERFRKFVVSCTDLTWQDNRHLVNILMAQGVEVSRESDGVTLSTNPIENNHLNALEKGLAVGGSGYVMYGDFDRLVVDSVRRPADGFLLDLGEYLRGEGENIDLTVLSRWIYYEPHSRIITESPVVDCISAVTGVRRCDSLGSGLVMKDGLAKEILDRSGTLPELSFPATKWVVLAKELGYRLESFWTGGRWGVFEIPQGVDHQLWLERAREIRGLRGEEAGDYYQFAAEGMNDYEPMVRKGILRHEYRAVEKSKTEWAKRITTGREILRFIGGEVAAGRLDETNDVRQAMNRAGEWLDRLEMGITDEGETLGEQFLKRTKDSWYQEIEEGRRMGDKARRV